MATQRIKFGPPGLLQIQHVQSVDQGKYICIVNNSQGEERVHISLIVTCNFTTHAIPIVGQDDDNDNKTFYVIFITQLRYRPKWYRPTKW